MQAASLIAIVQYPNLRGLDNPENFAANQERRDYILGAMLEAGSITRLQYHEALAVPVDEAFLSTADPVQNGCRSAVVLRALVLRLRRQEREELPPARGHQ